MSGEEFYLVHVFTVSIVEVTFVWTQNLLGSRPFSCFILISAVEEWKVLEALKQHLLVVSLVHRTSSLDFDLNFTPGCSNAILRNILLSVLLHNAISSLLSHSCNSFDLNFIGGQQPLEYLKNGDWIRLEHVAYVH